MDKSKRPLKVALVHDYLNEFGGAERVLAALGEIWPKAPIYTAFYVEGSSAYERFKNRKIIASWAQKIPFFAKLASPLRFLAPLIWGSFDFSGYDLVVTSASWYVTKGVVTRNTKHVTRKPIEICYCHNPPRYLYGYATALDWQKYWPVKLYALVVNHFMRVYDFEAAQRVNCFIANSKEVQGRIKKFYRREAEVIYPPVELSLPAGPVKDWSKGKGKEASMGKGLGLSAEKPKDLTSIPNRLPSLNLTPDSGYFLIVSRIVGGKGLRLAVEVANAMGFRLKIVGSPAGYGWEYQKLKDMAGPNVNFVGFVPDSELVELYSGARALLALSQDEDFGITPVEAMLCGTPVVAYDGGGYRETVVQGKTGLFFDPPTAGSLTLAINTFMDMEKRGAWDRAYIRRYAQKFSKDRFKREIIKFVQGKTK